MLVRVLSALSLDVSCVCQEQHKQYFHADFPFVFRLIVLLNDAMHVSLAFDLNVFDDCQERHHKQFHGDFPLGVSADRVVL